MSDTYAEKYYFGERISDKNTNIIKYIVVIIFLIVLSINTDNGSYAWFILPAGLAILFNLFEKGHMRFRREYNE